MSLNLQLICHPQCKTFCGKSSHLTISHRTIKTKKNVTYSTENTVQINYTKIANWNEIICWQFGPPLQRIHLRPWWYQSEFYSVKLKCKEISAIKHRCCRQDGGSPLPNPIFCFLFSNKVEVYLWISLTRAVKLNPHVCIQEPCAGPCSPCDAYINSFDLCAYSLSTGITGRMLGLYSFFIHML